MTSFPPYSPYLNNLTNSNGVLYFTTSNSTNGEELWQIDSAGNAVLVKDINPGANSSAPRTLKNVNGTLYFTADDGTRGIELWKIDDNGDAVLFKDIRPGAESSYPSNLTSINGITYFTASDVSNRQKLWKIDGMGNVLLVKDFNSGLESSYISELTKVGEITYFTVSDYQNRRELWKIDNTEDAVLIKSFSGDNYSYLENLTNVNGDLYFVSSKSESLLDGKSNYNQKLWKIDITGNAVLVKDINNSPGPSPAGGGPYGLSDLNLTNIKGTLYFTPNNATTGKELWKIDSTGNAVSVKNIGSSYDIATLTNVDDTLYFTSEDVTNGKELWKIDSSGNAVLVADVNRGTGSSYPSNLTNINGTIHFTAYDSNGFGKQKLWKIDSNGNTVLVADVNPALGSSNISAITNVAGNLYFTADDGETKLWKIDNNGNAILVKDSNPNVNSSSPQPFNRNLLKTTSEITGVSIQAVSQKGSNKVNEIGLFNVDDLNSRINGIAPGQAGYTKAAIGRSKSILTTLGGDFFNTDKQDIALDPNKIYQFFKVENGSLAELKQQLDKGINSSNIRLSISNSNLNSPIKLTKDGSQSGYDVSINNDELVLKVSKLDGLTPNRPIGSESQGKIEGRIIDLSNYKNRPLTVDITTKSDASYQIQIGFYVVKDASGAIESNGRTVNPGDADYAMLAVKNAIFNAELQSNRIDSKINQPIAGGLIYAPVAVAQGTMNDFVNKTSNNVQAYFNYVGANTDGVDHFRQISANTFGVEDMYGGGDRDFNDIVIQMKIK